MKTIETFEDALRYLAEYEPDNFKFDGECFQWMPEGFDRTRKVFCYYEIDSDDLDEILALIDFEYQVGWFAHGWQFCVWHKDDRNNYMSRNRCSENYFPTKLEAAKAAFCAAIREWEKGK